MHLDESTLKKVAALARIKVNEQEIKEYTEGLSNLLNWIQQLEVIPTDNVEPLQMISANNAPLREDIITEGNIRDKILSNAPDVVSDSFFSVPKVIE
jgi:aspartyl-tRNA(Asn)/glutamyl-tRNA(Gln) amidotransferase subunit C